tara:strand:+ start:575 stop:1282 length:708 start_codon:yes stop_codon:yes gene_type:complete
MSLLIIIPVLNEEKNIQLIYNKINKLKNIKKDILFVDDNSTDKTQSKILSLKKKNKKIFLLKRNFKMGVGSAHKDGIIWGYKKKYSLIITMDCDGTHDPAHIKKMLKLIKNKNFQLISTNRFLKENSLSDWSLWRIALTNVRHILISKMLDMKFDSSGAYRCYNINQIKLEDILKAKNNSYSFFWESMFFLSKKYHVKEIAINLPGRVSGSSKMRFKDIFEALHYLCSIFFKYRF